MTDTMKIAQALVQKAHGAGHRDMFCPVTRIQAWRELRAHCDRAEEVVTAEVDEVHKKAGDCWKKLRRLPEFRAEMSGKDAAALDELAAALAQR